MQKFEVTPIGKVTVNNDGSFIELDEKYIPALTALDGFSHLNLIWWFSEYDNEEMRNILEAPKPYTKAPDVMGIFATRSPVRPNPLALSTVEVLSIDRQKGVIRVTQIDANDGTSVLDVKPYTPSLGRIETPGVPEWCSHWPKSAEASEHFDWASEFNF
ncbi:MAG TPA: tRNA (N6-threonylcarbamoyladenosine(37)-N6)-methyltransferase TrmO [Clostridiales bacterium]|nr:tRNA (N6-threonylcarbamoyladenosine(37)-N6)-methyltransferase TrmO [Clostridiales bacterium]